jgi:hypothetical protein
LLLTPTLCASCSNSTAVSCRDRSRQCYKTLLRYSLICRSSRRSK